MRREEREAERSEESRKRGRRERWREEREREGGERREKRGRREK